MLSGPQGASAISAAVLEAGSRQGKSGHHPGFQGQRPGYSRDGVQFRRRPEAPGLRRSPGPSQRVSRGGRGEAAAERRGALRLAEAQGVEGGGAENPGAEHTGCPRHRRAGTALSQREPPGPRAGVLRHRQPRPGRDRAVVELRPLRPPGVPHHHPASGGSFYWSGRGRTGAEPRHARRDADRRQPDAVCGRKAPRQNRVGKWGKVGGSHLYGPLDGGDPVHGQLAPLRPPGPGGVPKGTALEQRRQPQLRTGFYVQAHLYGHRPGAGLGADG